MKEQLTKEIEEIALQAISDDYESFERVFEDVERWAMVHGKIANKIFVLNALRSLVNDGYAQAYILSARPGSKAEAVAFAENRLDELWFYVSPAGKELIQSRQAQANSDEQ